MTLVQVPVLQTPAVTGVRWEAAETHGSHSVWQPKQEALTQTR